MFSSQFLSWYSIAALRLKASISEVSSNAWWKRKKEKLKKMVGKRKGGQETDRKREVQNTA